MSAKLTVISLGWGVQSWTMAAMSALGDLPKVDFAIHSDTSWERERTYEFAEQWAPWLEKRGVRVITVSDYEQTQKVATSKTDAPFFTNGASVFIPAFSRDESDSVIDHWGGVSRNAHTSPNGGHGQLRRQCTQRWKIAPMRRFISDELKRRGISKSEGIVEQWIGITLDEWQRAKDSDVKYIKSIFPLLDRGMDRAACLAYLDLHGLPSPGKSACVFCPYQNRFKWQEMKQKNGDDWQTAISVDNMIRDKRPPYPLYVHPDRKPLEEAVVIPEDHGAVQINLLDMLQPDDKDAECDSGHCFF